MKLIERASEKYTAIPKEKTFSVRLDGHHFSAFTKRFTKPFDQALNQAMIDTTKAMIIHFNASSAYTQSDEITLVFSKRGELSEHMYGGRVPKILSLFAAFATSRFNQSLNKQCPLENDSWCGWFDARILVFDEDYEVLNHIIWRSRDAYRNAVTLQAHALFGHKAIDRKNTAEKLAMMVGAGFDWDSVDNHNRYGSLIRRVKWSLETETNSGRFNVMPIEQKRITFSEEQLNYVLAPTLCVTSSEPIYAVTL